MKRSPNAYYLLGCVTGALAILGAFTPGWLRWAILAAAGGLLVFVSREIDD